MSNRRTGGKELRPWLKIAKDQGATIEFGRHIKVRNAEGRLVMTLPLAGSRHLGRGNDHVMRKRWAAQGWPCP